MKKKYIDNEGASELISQQGIEFAVIHNPEYIFPSLEICPLAEKITTAQDSLVAVVMDLDGTIATTEELSIHSLEFMVRKISGRITKESWKGLEPFIDYPNIIGNSTTKHVEYLVSRYHNFIKPELVKESYFYAALWTIISGHDKSRTNEVKNNLINLGCKNLLKDQKFKELILSGIFDEDLIQDYFLPKYGNDFDTGDFNGLVRAAVDIFYQRYHSVLEKIKNGEEKFLAVEMFGNETKHLVEAMPGIGIFLSLIKGWLGEDIVSLIPLLDKELRNKYPKSHQSYDEEKVKANLRRLSRMFEEKPLSAAVVTSSIFYEADIIMNELFKVISLEIDSWQIPSERKSFLKNKFSRYTNIYDAFITADNSSEIRLKPHRDLYSLALYQLGIPKNKFDQVIGLEDSESGVTAIRSAGIGICVAVPFAKTSGHDLSAATYVLQGGLPELLLYHNLFIKGQE